eukprot:GSA120T00025984001.1
MQDEGNEDNFRGGANAFSSRGNNFVPERGEENEEQQAQDEQHLSTGSASSSPRQYQPDGDKTDELPRVSCTTPKRRSTSSRPNSKQRGVSGTYEMQGPSPAGEERTERYREKMSLTHRSEQSRKLEKERLQKQKLRRERKEANSSSSRASSNDSSFVQDGRGPPAQHLELPGRRSTSVAASSSSPEQEPGRASDAVVPETQQPVQQTATLGVGATNGARWLPGFELPWVVQQLQGLAAAAASSSSSSQQQHQPVVVQPNNASSSTTPGPGVIRNNTTPVVKKEPPKAPRPSLQPVYDSWHKNHEW